MIYFSRSFAFWLVLTAHAGLADQITVRSGEHSTFSRLVMLLPAEASWEISGDGRERKLRIENHVDGFDTSRVFNLIQRRRLSAIHSSPSSLTLFLACECTVRQFKLPDGHLVVDVVDSQPEALAETNETERLSKTRPRSKFNYGDLLWSATPLGTQLEASTQATSPSHTEQQANIVPEYKTAAAALMADTRDRLLRGVSYAMTRGVLTSATPNLPKSPDSGAVEPEVLVVDTTQAASSIVEPNIGNVRVTSSIDLPQAGGNEHLTTLGAACPDEDSFRVATWGTDDPFAMQISIARSLLYGEVDRFDETAALQLAKLYLFFGFGAEARQVLLTSQSLPSDYPFLMDLADIMDLGYSESRSLPQHYADCDSEAALWTLLAAPTISRNQPINAKAALRAMAGMPEHLRKYIAPLLSSRLLELGDAESAAAALRDANRVGSASTAGTTLAEAELEIHRGQQESAERLLENVVDANAPESPVALIKFVNSHLDAEEEVPADIALLIEAYAQELRDGDLGPELQRTHVLAASKSGQYTKALKALDKLKVGKDQNFISDLNTIVFSEIVLKADDIEFLEKVFSHVLGRHVRLNNDVAIQIVERLLDLGFAQQADSLLSSVPSEPHNLSRQLLAARIALDLDQPYRVQSELVGQIGAQSDLMRARAKERIGDKSEAAALYNSADDTASALRAAWLAEDWITATPPDAPIFGEIRELEEETIVPIKMGDGMLARSAEAIDRSAAARGVLGNLLSQLSVPEKPRLE